MLERLWRNARRLHAELSDGWAGLSSQPEIEAETARIFAEGRFPSAGSEQLQAGLKDFYQRALGLPAPQIEEVHSLQAAARAFENGPRLPLKSALLLASLHQPDTIMKKVAPEWTRKIEPVWNLPRAHQTVPLALWNHSLGLVSAQAPRWLYHCRAGRGGLLERLAGRLLECGLWCAWLRADQVVALRAPSRLRVDADGGLDSSRGAAIEWPDGNQFWAMGRTVLEPDFDPAQVTLAALQVAALERREALIDIKGYPWLLEQAGARLVDFDLEVNGCPRRLLEIPLPPENVVVAVVVCPSTGKQAYLRVPPDIQTCREAVAWTFGYDQSASYQPWQQT